MSRPLSRAKVGEIAVAMAFAALDTGADRKAVLDAWASLGSAMPLALDLARNAIEARGLEPRDLRKQIDELIDGD